MAMGMFDNMTNLQNGLNAAWLRNSTILNNVANVDTPDFKSSGVEFESLYQRMKNDQADGFQAKQTRATHMDFGTGSSTVEGVVVKRDNTTYREDGNNVDIDQEMTDFAKNVIYYNALLRKVNGQFSQMKSAIQGQ